jgi:phosphotransferase system IIB component
MAFNAKDAGQSSASAKKLYTGLVTANVVSVNPNAAEKAALYGGEVKEEPVYIGKNQEGTVDQVRIDFHLDTNVTDEEGVPRVKTTTSFYVVNEGRTSQTGKINVTNKFGQFVWVTPEDLASGTSPYTWFSTIGMRAAFRGEEDLLNFIKNLLNVPNLKGDMSNVADAEACFTNVPSFFTGDVSEVKNAAASTNNKVKVLMGVRTTDEGKMYQAIYNKKVERAYSTQTQYIAKSLAESQEFGAYSDVDFGSEPFTFGEYSLEPSTQADVAMGAPMAAPAPGAPAPGGWGAPTS